MEIIINGYNATNSDITFHSAEGQIAYRTKHGGKTIDSGALPTPTIRRDKPKEPCVSAYTEFMVVLDQHFSPSDVETILETLESGETIHCMLDAPDVHVCAENEPSKTARLPMWNAIRLRKPKPRYVSDQVIGVTVNTTIDLESDSEHR